MYTNYQIGSIGQFVDSLKYRGDFMNNVVGRKLQLHYVNIYKLENLEFPPELDVYKTQFRFRLSATVFDARNQLFITNTYKSPFIPFFISDIIDFGDEDSDNEDVVQQSEKIIPVKKGISGKPLTKYMHSPLWFGFYANKGQFLKETKIAVEFSLYEYDNQSKVMQGSKTLGYAIIDLTTKSQYADLYSGSVRDLLCGLYSREQKTLGQQIHYEAKKSSKVSVHLMKLIGAYRLFGQEDIIYGLRDLKIPPAPRDLLNAEYDDALDFFMPRVELHLNRILEIDIKQFLIEQQIERTQIKEVVVHKLKQYLQVFTHNGWKAINDREYDNLYQLTPLSENAKFAVFQSDKEVRSDRIFEGAKVIFQLVHQYQITVAEVQQDPIELYIGWFALFPDDLMDKRKGNIELLLQNSGRTFNKQGYYCKHNLMQPGHLIVQFVATRKLAADVQNMDSNQAQEVTKMKQQLMEMAKNNTRHNHDGESLKIILIQHSLKRKIAIKTGAFKDENVMKQNKLMSELFELKDQTQNIVTGLIDSDTRLQIKTQVLLNEFNSLLELSQQNFHLAKDKYNIQQKNLISYQERKNKVDNIELQQSILANETFDRWQYSQIYHPNLEVVYKFNSLEFIEHIRFGNRDIPQSRIVKLPTENSSGKSYIKISLHFHTYRSVLKILAMQNREDFLLPSIYTFDNYIPMRLQLVAHILGQQVIVNTQFNTIKSKAEYERQVKDRFQFKGIPSGYLVVPADADLENTRCIVEIWNAESMTVMGRCFVALTSDQIALGDQRTLVNQMKEYDIISYDNKLMIGTIDITTIVEYTDDIPIVGRSRKPFIMSIKQQQQDIKEEYIPPSNYYDIMRVYISQTNDFEIPLINPLILTQKLIKQFKKVTLAGNKDLNIRYSSSSEIIISGTLPQPSETTVYLDVESDKNTIICVYKVIIYNCESLIYDSHLGWSETLYTLHQSQGNDSQIKLASSNPYTVGCSNSLPIIMDTMCKIPLNCVSMELDNLETRFTIQQGGRVITKLVKFRPKENVVSQLYDIRIAKNKKESQQFQYQNKLDKSVILQMVPSSNLMTLKTTIYELQPFQKCVVSCSLEPYSLSKRALVKLFVNDPQASYFDLISAIKVEIFIESQCRDTHTLIQSMLPLLDVTTPDLTLEFIIFGKGIQKQNEDSTWHFQCQHGEVECYGNLLEVCAQQNLNWREQLAFLGCMHNDKKRTTIEYDYYSKKCLQNIHCAFEKTMKCTHGVLGNYLQHKAADQTQQQQLTRIPWIVVDNVQQEGINDFMKWICSLTKCIK